MSEESGFDRVPGVEQLFVKRRQDKKIGLLFAKLVDGFLGCVLSAKTTHFFLPLNCLLKLGRSYISRDFRFPGCTIAVSHEASATIYMS